jgi:hypothetical protein
MLRRRTLARILEPKQVTSNRDWHQLVVACGLASVCLGVIHAAAYAAMLFYLRYAVGAIEPVRLVAYQVVTTFLMVTFISLCVSLPFALAIRKGWLLYRSRAGRRKRGR